MAESEEWSCGKGLAANAALPAKLGALMGALAALLDNHTRGLGADARSQPERNAYRQLVADQRALAADLQALATKMEGFRDLPMATHDEAILSDKLSRDVFAAFIAAEEDLFTHLQEQTREYRAMLEAMDAESGA